MDKLEQKIEELRKTTGKIKKYETNSFAFYRINKDGKKVHIKTLDTLLTGKTMDEAIEEIRRLYNETYSNIMGSWTNLQTNPILKLQAGHRGQTCLSLERDETDVEYESRLDYLARSIIVREQKEIRDRDIAISEYEQAIMRLTKQTEDYKERLKYLKAKINKEE